MRLEITQLGYVVGPLTILLFFLRPYYLLPWTMFLSFFQSSSVLNVYLTGYPFGIQPGYFSAVFLLLWYWRISSRHSLPQIPGVTIKVLWPLILFTIYGVFSALIFPRIFSGQFYVFSPRDGLTFDSMAPIAPSNTNISQPLYMVFLFLVTMVTAHLIHYSKDLENKTISAFMFGGGIAIAVGLYQIVAYKFGWPFPSDFLNTNAGYDQGYYQAFGNIKRLTSVFTEPSMAAFHLVAVFAFTFWSVLSGSSITMIVLWVSSALTLLFTTSTTSYVAATVMGTITCLLAIRSKAKFKRLTLIISIALVLCVLAVSVWLLLNQGSNEITAVLNEILFNKTDTLSFQYRLAADTNALQVLLWTWGLGDGLGSTRSSSLLTNVLGNMGIVGLLCLIGLIVRVRKVANDARKLSDQYSTTRIRAITLALVSMITAGIVGVPDLTFILFWLNLGLLIGLSTREGTLYSNPANNLTHDNTLETSR